MRKVSICIIVLSFLAGIWSCEEVKKTEPQKLQWLLGSWEMETPDGMLYEKWDYQSSKVLTGSSIALDNGDTTFSESAIICETDSGTFYIVSVANQAPIQFRLTDNSRILGKTAGVAVFENMVHDFPQRIIYYSLQGDSLYARIEGLVDGKMQREEYYYGRKK